MQITSIQRFMPWIIQHATFQINRYLVRSDGKTSFEEVFKKPQRSPIVHFGERFLAHIQSQPPSQTLQIRASSQKSLGHWLSQDRHPPLTLARGLAYRGRVVDASPYYKPKIPVVQDLLCGKSTAKAPYYRKKVPGVQGKRWSKYR